MKGSKFWGGSAQGVQGRIIMRPFLRSIIEESSNH